MQARAQLESMLGEDAFGTLEIYVHGHFGRAKHLKLPPVPRPGGRQ